MALVYQDTTLRLELMNEMSDVQAHVSDVRVKEMEVVVMTKLYDSLGLLGMVSTGAWAVSVVDQSLGSS